VNLTRPRWTWRSLATAACTVASLASAPLACGAPVTSLDDVVFWTGAGANRAAVAIDFDGESTADQSLVWGYRWDGVATGRGMLVAIVTADPRLYLKVNSLAAVESAFYGFGYDRNDNATFSVEGEFGSAFFDAAGIALGGHDDSAAAVDPGDWYREGWEEHFWRWGYSRDNPWSGGAWATPGDHEPGPSRWELVDGEWHSWALAPVIPDDPGNYPELYAANPVIAAPPGGHADFDGDSDVTGGDLLAWQRGLGQLAPSPMDGDANSDGAVDGRDLALWQSHAFAASTTASASRLTSVPEPAFSTTCASALFALVLLVSRFPWRDS
jgi:hypothetical protein